MNAQSEQADQITGHLDYYKRYGISPVRYLAADAAEHLERRDSLYRLIGLPPVAFKGARVLEVAPGSGQNSLYVASCQPASYDLVEPNPTGLDDIARAYDAFDIPHTSPSLHPVKIQDFSPEHDFDIVICENWLGRLEHERAIIAMLAGLVAPGGVMVITAVPLSGFFPNVMRKLLALRLMRPEEGFEATTERLLKAFSPHLATMPAMTRSHRDWIHDCMLNPHYLHVALPFETLLDAVDDGMEVLSTCPRFVTDWRWFKGMVGEGRAFNERMLASETENLHNFVDCRKVDAQRNASENEDLAQAFRDGYQAALSWQTAHQSGDVEFLQSSDLHVSSCLERISEALSPFDHELAKAFEELRELWCRPSFSPEDVAAMRHFGGVFGRETVYVSMTRTRS
jgi:hypothetical protein